MSESITPVRILHLDDSGDDAALIRLHLKAKKLDCAVTWVSEEDAFKRRLDEGGVDIVLSDYRMPGFDGDQALRFVRERHPQLPFIMVTGELGEDRAIETLKRGATDYVLKGNLGRLVPSIERALREARAELERRRAEEELADLKERLALELADMRRLHDLSAELLHEDNPERMLGRVLKACLDLLGADKGNVQFFDAASGVLRIVAHSGFGPEFLREFEAVGLDRICACGRALATGRRIVVRDVAVDDDFVELRDAFRREGLSAVVSTPLMARDGTPFGMLSTHFSRPHVPSERDLRLLDLYIQQAERILEHKQSV